MEKTLVLQITLAPYQMQLPLEAEFLVQSAEAFDRLDQQMDDGIQLGRSWIEHPDREQRCQFAADKLLAALESDNEGLARISAGYILARLPDTRHVLLDNNGEPEAHRFE